MKLWATDLETWRWWRLLDKESTLLQELRHDFVETDTMKAGSAFHLALEEVQGKAAGAGLPDLVRGPLDARYKGTPYRFRLEGEFSIPEASGIEERMELRLGDHLVTGRVDAVTADGRVLDYKTTAKTVNLERYIDSWQWRVYLCAFPRARSFTYNVFQVKPIGWEGGVSWHKVIAQHDLTLYRYPGIIDDVRGAIRDFLDAAVSEGWTGR